MTDEFWLQRLKAEQAALETKIMDLLAFYDKPQFGHLSYTDKMLMMKQGVVMAEYKSILSERIYNAEKKHG